MGRDKQVVVRFSEDELRVLRVRADDEQRPLSQWIRMQLGVTPRPTMTVGDVSSREEKMPVEVPAPQNMEPVRVKCPYGCRAIHVHVR